MFGLDDILGGVGGFIGSILGNSEASGQQDAATQAMLQALAQMQGVSVPQLQELLGASQAPGSAMSGVTTDPALRSQQMATLQGLQDLVKSGGMTVGDKVAQQQAMDSAARAEQGQRGAVLADMASRGQLGGGAELASKLQAQQQTAANSYQAGSQAAAQAQQRALAAMIQGGQMAGDVRQQDFGQAAAKAQAQDVMNRFNAAQRSGAYQDQFRDQMAKAGGVATAQDNLANYYGGQAQRTRNYYTGLGQGIGNVIGGGGYDYVNNRTPKSQQQQNNGGAPGLSSAIPGASYDPSLYPG